MAWRLARSLESLRDEIDEKAPNRDKRSDGTVGDLKHSVRKSDHNPNSLGVVTALDLTHDPAGGMDSYALAHELVANPDERLKYVISNGQIASRDKGWKWRKYTGRNPHSHHVHISVMADPKLYDDPKRWGVTPEYSMDDYEPTRLPTLRRGDKGLSVKLLQQFLDIEDDGQFGAKTEAAVRKFQKDNKLVIDGVCGPYFWDAARNSL